MICGIKIFQGYLQEDHKKALERKFQFGGYIDIENGDEIPVCSRKNKNKSYKGMLWRKAVHREMVILLGWRIDPLTKNEYWHLIVKGSLHKYANNGNNSNLFTASNAIIALDELCKELRIDKCIAKLTQFELAVNLGLPELKYSTLKYCELFLLRYKTYPFEWMRTDAGNEKIGKVAVLTHRQIKVYVTGDNVLRFEIHWSDMQELANKYNLSLLSSLTEEILIRMASELLPATFKDIVSLNGIVLEDKFLLETFKGKDRTILKDYVNQTYLVHQDHLIQMVLTDRQAWEKLRKKHKRYRDRFHYLVNTFGDKSNELILQRILDTIEISKQKCPILDIGIKSKIGTHSNKDNIKRLNKDRTNNNNMQEVKTNSMNHGAINSSTKKSKKQEVKDKVELKEIQRSRFMEALRITLVKLST